MMGFEGLVSGEFRDESECSSSLPCSNIKLGFAHPRKKKRKRGCWWQRNYGGVIVKFLARGRHFICD